MEILGKATLSVIYSKLIKNKQFVKLEDTQIQPEIKLTGNKSSIYSLIVHDPNAVGGNKIHWARINIKNNNINSGIDIIPYKGPAPPPNSGIHNYIFELYKQPNKIDGSPMNDNDRVKPLDDFKQYRNPSNLIATIKFVSRNSSDKTTGGKSRKGKRKGKRKETGKRNKKTNKRRRFIKRDEGKMQL